MLPRTIVWEDGLKYDIDRVIDIRPAYAAKAGGQGDRYTIQVNGARTYLYFERSSNPTDTKIGRWFVERKVPLKEYFMRTDDKKHQCWLNEGETIRSFHPVLDCALREFADHDAFVSFIFEMVDIF